MGKWSASGGLNITEVPRQNGMNITDSLSNRSLVITTILVRSSRGYMCEGERSFCLLFYYSVSNLLFLQNSLFFLVCFTLLHVSVWTAFQVMKRTCSRFSFSLTEMPNSSVPFSVSVLEINWPGWINNTRCLPLFETKFEAQPSPMSALVSRITILNWRQYQLSTQLAYLK